MMGTHDQETVTFFKVKTFIILVGFAISVIVLISINIRNILFTPYNIFYPPGYIFICHNIREPGLNVLL